MLTEPQKKWVAALRSGKFKQTRGQLRSLGGYCCLGVLCSVAKREGVKFERDWGGRISLPDKVRAWAGLNTNDGFFKDDNGPNFLTNMNDRGAPFTEIADLIESCPNELFSLSQPRNVMPAGAGVQACRLFHNQPLVN